MPSTLFSPNHRWPAHAVVAGSLWLLLATPLLALDQPAPVSLCAAPSGVAASSTLELPGSIAVDYTVPELTLFEDLADQRLDRHTLLTAALVASGVTDGDRLQQYHDQFEQFIARRRSEGCDALLAPQRAAALLEALHRELLSSGYEQPCTDLTRVLDEGHFNCVSATILWQCLAGRFDLASVAMEMPGHMNAEIFLENQPFEVETTCARWFQWQSDPARRQQAIDAVRSSEGNGNSTRRPLNQAGLIAAIYYNRGIDLLDAGRFAEAVAANAKAHRLDPASAIARGNLLASINNWALCLASEQQYDRACHMLASARRMAPAHEPFQINYVAVHQQWIDALVTAGQLTDADRIAVRLARELPEQPFFSRVHEQLQRQLRETANSI